MHMADHDNLIDLARRGALAVAEGERDESAALLARVSMAMSSLTAAECEWLSIAVANGAFDRQISEPQEYTGADVPMVATPDGEVWDI